MPIEPTPREENSKLDVELVIAMSNWAEVEVPRQGDNPTPAEARLVVDAATARHWGCKLVHDPSWRAAPRNATGMLPADSMSVGATCEWSPSSLASDDSPCALAFQELR